MRDAKDMIQYRFGGQVSMSRGWGGKYESRGLGEGSGWGQGIASVELKILEYSLHVFQLSVHYSGFSRVGKTNIDGVVWHASCYNFLVVNVRTLVSRNFMLYFLDTF